MLLLNSHPDFGEPLVDSDAALFADDAVAEVLRIVTTLPGYAATPLRSFDGLAKETGVASIHVKDESLRSGMGSFKALGGSYAVIRLVIERLEARLGRSISVDEFGSDELRPFTSGLTVACATDGNHGKSVAAGARFFGARAVILVHSGVSDERVAAIAAFGAEIIRVNGNYDDSVAEATRLCEANGWLLVSDTSWPGYERIPGLVMQGYAVMLDEAVRALPEPPTHTFVQAGVGGLAAAVAGYFHASYSGAEPHFTVVEPDRADCLLQSMAAGERRKIAHGDPTIMAMLECYEPSLVAWRILTRLADAFSTVTDEEAARAMRCYAHPLPGDPAIVSGESGAATLAAFMQIAGNDESRRQIGMGPDSRIFLINTEGATDRSSYERLVGLKPEDVFG